MALKVGRSLAVGDRNPPLSLSFLPPHGTALLTHWAAGERAALSSAHREGLTAGP